MDSPLNHIWGPNLWTILHSCAEKIGSSPASKVPKEEARIWTAVLSSLRYSLPCPLCKKHFIAYCSAKPITVMSKEFIRTWLYELHNDINQRNEKEILIPIEVLPELYSRPINYSIHLNLIITEMNKAVQLGWCSREDTQRTIRLLQEMKRFYDFF